MVIHRHNHASVLIDARLRLTSFPCEQEYVSMDPLEQMEESGPAGLEQNRSPGFSHFGLKNKIHSSDMYNYYVLNNVWVIFFLIQEFFFLKYGHATHLYCADFHKSSVTCRQ